MLLNDNKPSPDFKDVCKVIRKENIDMPDTIVNEGFYKSIFDEAESSKAKPNCLEKVKKCSPDQIKLFLEVPKHIQKAGGIMLGASRQCF